MDWPAWTGYAFHGERTSEPGSVAALVLQELSDCALIIPDVGDERAIWVELQPLRSATRCEGLIVLGVYAPQAGYPMAVRTAFWNDRKHEVIQLRRRKNYTGWRFALAGDVNLHFGELSPLNVRYEGPLEREVLRMLHNPEFFGAVLKNPPRIPTYVSSTVVNVIGAPADMLVTVDVVSPDLLGFRSDHSGLFARFPGGLEPCADRSIGSARWLPQGD